MGKKDRIKKGIILDLFRNYGHIKILQDDEIVPFEYNKNMIVSAEGVEYIKYSIDVECKVKNMWLRNRNIKIATDIKFLGITQYKVRKKDNDYLTNVREKFNEFGILLNNKNEMKKEFYDMHSLKNNIFKNELVMYYEKIFQSEENIFYEWLKIKGFQPYMLDYLVDGVIEKTTVSKEKININVLINLNEIDKLFREKTLKWILGIENTYKSLISRISKQENGGKELANKLVEYWKNSSDTVKEKQYKNAKNRHKFLPQSEYYDYISSDIEVTVEDLLDQIDLTNLPDVLKKFKEISKNKNSKQIQFISPWILDIVNNISVLTNLSFIRNAAAHDRPLLPLILNSNQNPNIILEKKEPIKRGNIDKWFIYPLLKEMLIEENKFNEKEILEYIQSIYGNPYRKGWFELNFIYVRFISLFESTIFSNYLKESEYFFGKINGRGAIEKLYNPILKDIKEEKLLNMVDNIIRDYENANKIAYKHLETFNINDFIFFKGENGCY